MDQVRIGVLGTGIIIRGYHMLTLEDNPHYSQVPFHLVASGTALRQVVRHKQL